MSTVLSMMSRYPEVRMHLEQLYENHAKLRATRAQVQPPTSQAVTLHHANRKKISTTLRLSPDVLAGFRATGPGWQTRMNQTLLDAITQGKISGMTQ